MNTTYIASRPVPLSQQQFRLNHHWISHPQPGCTSRGNGDRDVGIGSYRCRQLSGIIVFLLDAFASSRPGSGCALFASLGSQLSHLFLLLLNLKTRNWQRVLTSLHYHNPLSQRSGWIHPVWCFCSTSPLPYKDLSVPPYENNHNELFSPSVKMF